VITEREAAMPDSPSTTPSGPAGRKALHCWIDAGVSDRLRTYSTDNGVKIQHVAEKAIDAYLRERGA